MSGAPCRAEPASRTLQPGSAGRAGSPVRETLREYSRDTYIWRRSPCASCDAADRFDGGIIDCSTGVFAFGPSPRIVRALREFDVHRLNGYTPAAVEAEFRRAILARYAHAGVAADQLFLGHGSFNLMERLVHKFLEPRAMGGIGPQFSEIPSEFMAAGGRYEPLPLLEPDGALPMTALEASLERGAWSVLYIDNPNNPLGRAFDLTSIERLASICDRAGTALLVDEAFGDYLPDTESAIALVPRYRNVIVVRSLSKAFGLAAERVGYVFLSSQLSERYRHVDVPFEPGVVAQTLAIEALADQSWLESVRRDVREAKTKIVDALAGTGLRALPTHPDVAIVALHGAKRDLTCELRQRGILVLPGSGFAATHPGWDDSYCRIRIVLGDELDRLCGRLATL